MCGIAGWLSWEKRPDEATVAAMTRALQHRGPDGEGVVSLGPVVLGHRRLAVIDVRPESDQPLATTDQAYWISFNGEIYNFRELRRSLEARGVRFRTEGDTEVVLEAYRAWGKDCVERLDGMFAFALWDRQQQTLFLARDRAGEKPLFYAELPDGGLVFSSEPRALRAHPAVPAEVDPVALAHYLSLNYTLGERALIKSVQRLPAAHHMTIAPGRAPVVARYWDLAPHYRNKRRFKSEAQATEELNALISDAVRNCMVSDVPLGAFLSGGVDSSTIVAAMTDLRAAERINTFSMGFSEKSFSELDEAGAVARYLGVKHRDRVLTPDSQDMIAGLIHAADEPLADSSALPTYWLARMAREHVTVALSGDGGDECMAGYETYVADRLHRFASLAPGPTKTWLCRLVQRFMPVSFTKVSFDYKVRQFLAGLKYDGARAHYSWRTIFTDEERHALMNPAWRTELDGIDSFEEFRPHFAEVADCHPIDQFLYVDLKTWLPDDILVKLDRMTMAHSLEARAPFLDHRLVEFTASLPASWKLKGLRKKHLLKKSQQGRLPDWVLKRRKQGFNSPISEWFQGPLLDFARDALADRRIDTWFDRRAIEALWEAHLNKRRDNGLKLLALLGFALWLRAL